MALEPCPVLSQGAKLTGISDELENLLFFIKTVLLALQEEWGEDTDIKAKISPQTPKCLCHHRKGGGGGEEGGGVQIMQGVPDLYQRSSLKPKKALKWKIHILIEFC